MRRDEGECPQGPNAQGRQVWGIAGSDGSVPLFERFEEKLRLSREHAPRRGRAREGLASARCLSDGGDCRRDKKHGFVL